MKTDELKKVLCTLMCEAYQIEKTMTDKLPDLAKHAEHPQVQQILENHIMETKNQANRLERAHELAEIKIKDVETPVLDALLEEGNTLYKGAEEGSVRDAAILIAFQRVQHQEIVLYGSIIALAKACGLPQVAELLKESLDEEYTSDKAMTKIAEDFLNMNAEHADKQAA